MSTRLPGFHLFFRFLHHFSLANFATNSIMVTCHIYRKLCYDCCKFFTLGQVLIDGYIHMGRLISGCIWEKVNVHA